VRGILIVNPQATSTTAHDVDVVGRTLLADGLADLDVAYTRYRGHARELATTAETDVVAVLGGDGAINEVVNGLMDRTSRGQAEAPVLAAIPGGGGNVFARALGLPPTPARAASVIGDLLAASQVRTIGLGLAGDRYFTFSAGLGFDAEVVYDVEQQRANGRKESSGLFVRTILRRYYTGTDRRRPALTLERDGQPSVPDLFMGIITNSAPWTYFHGRPLLPKPDPDFTSGLDVLALSRLHMATILSAIGQMMCTPDRNRAPRGRHVITANSLDSVTFACSRPIALHVDGEYLGETESVKFQFVPAALRVVAPPRTAEVNRK
jgi:diacylglycerol kinase family enzyme